MLRTATTAAALVALLLATPATAAPDPQAITSAMTGVSATALSGVATSLPINMWSGFVAKDLTVRLKITPGNTATVTVKCYERPDTSTEFSQIPLCDSASPSSCKPDSRVFTLADYATDGGGFKYIVSHWTVREMWQKCSAEGSGTGTVTMTGTRFP